MIIKKILNNQDCIFHIVKRKRQKRIIIRKIDRCQFQVSAPYKANPGAIEKAIDRHKDHLLKLPLSVDMAKKIQDSTALPIFDTLFFIKENTLDKNYIDYETKTIHIAQNKDRYAIIKTLLKEPLLEAIDALKEKYKEDFPLSDVRFRLQYMKSKYGSCQPIKKHISLNLELVHYPKEFLEFIFVHEATHLFYPNHSQNFYHHLARYIKNHREMKQTLESTRKLFYQTSTD